MGMLEGALIALAGVLLGRFLPSRRKGPKPAKLPAAVCGCTHHHSMHSPETGKCNAAVKAPTYVAGTWTGWEYLACASVRYSGPVPLPEYYAPEIGSTGA